LHESAIRRECGGFGIVSSGLREGKTLKLGVVFTMKSLV